MWQLILTHDLYCGREARDADLLRLLPGARIFAAAECTRGAGRRASLLFCESHGGAVGFAEFERSYGDQGHPGYHPALMLKVWLYAYALGVTSSRRLEQRIREDLAFRYLAAGAQPDFWALNEFRKRHGRAMNDVFTQVVETARSVGMGRLGHVAIDSTRIAANASLGRMESETKLRGERARFASDSTLAAAVRKRRSQRDAGERGGAGDGEAAAAAEGNSGTNPAVEESRDQTVSRSDADSRLLRVREDLCWATGRRWR